MLDRIGDTKTEKYVRCWHECQLCKLPARYSIAFILPNARSNPASTAYGRDDISWCSDDELFACKEHLRDVETISEIMNKPMKWCATFTLKSYKHMGFYWDRLTQ